MFDRILFVTPRTTLGAFLERSLAAEGYEIERVTASAPALRKRTGDAPPLVLVNGVGLSDARWGQLRDVNWPAPVIALVKREVEAGEGDALPPGWRSLAWPVAFQDLVVEIQDTLYRRTLAGRRPFQLPAELTEHMEEILSALREDLNARCVVLSSSGGRLITTVGVVDHGVALSLAALMSAGFSATAKAAQLLGDDDMFDSSLQESEGYGLYAIRLRDRLILSVAFSSRITVGMVRHYAAQAAVDILEVLVREAGEARAVHELGVDDAFRETVTHALENILGE
jgi:predicted regulator of Ras-like GTPase activity (Roadblock/LC7/MglB family)